MNDLAEFHTLKEVNLENVIKAEYRTYQIYTLMDRAIPYLRDGLKPGQRRILYTLWKNKAKGLMKVSSATGLVLTLHPHGPQSVEAAIVNLAQDYTFANNYPLIDKKGYFGERMETRPAASRYIECKIGKVAELLLFDDINQVQMVPNYDEKSLEPLYLLPKLPLMLLNGAEGIGTGFSSSIPSFHHKDIIASMISYIETGRPKKMKPFFHHYRDSFNIETSGRMIFSLKVEKIGDQFVITEIPRGYDAARIYKFLNKFVDSGDLKDYLDFSENNEIHIQLLFKKSQIPTLEEVQKNFKLETSFVPNYTLISERGVKIFDKVEDIISIFTEQRLEVVQKRYELLCQEYQSRIIQNNEIIRFIKEKHYEKATKSQNRKTFVDHLQKSQFTYLDYLADMAIYRMTKEEVEKRKILIQEDQKSLKDFLKIAKSKELVKKKLIEELKGVNDELSDWLKIKEKEREQLKKKLKNKKLTTAKTAG